MKSFVISFLLFIILLLTAGISAQEKPNTATNTNNSRSEKSIKNLELRDELLKRHKAARDIRAELIRSLRP